MSKYIALTGGIGSGKSVVSKVFASMNIPVYDSDSRAKQLMETNECIIKSLQNLIGKNVYKQTKLQKDIMAQAIFSDSNLCKQVNAIIHPQVWNDYKLWSDSKNVHFTIMETALLFESDLYKNFDAIITVVASEDVRIKRVMKRDSCGVDNVTKRIKNQLSTEIAKRKADFIIENNNTFVLPQIMNINRELNLL